MTSQKPALVDLSPYTIFDEHLREVPTDLTVFAGAIRQAEKQLKQAVSDGDDAAILRLHGYIGDACRVAGRLDEAVEYLGEAIRLSRRTGNKRAEAANRIRLAEAKKYQGEGKVAERMLQEVAGETRVGKGADLHHFALQHWGKCLLDQGKPAEAISVLEKALALREALGNEGWLRSTRMALERAKKKSCR
ncbi:tetratricopeptide repeat protein [Desmospora profundinema]|uniref:Tetratricopeptide (TPR) repeat protein n=1 Tax=Desmospora profundinema TaxID=1571184 RepID=A0ABU1IPD7_9BACL|nr:tetratricopeptide repeat protein [Desmospora profundinema]MDR6226581.1 tetratricopeptide (TPR) repeat protein [Desmospora profundinema]